MANKVLMSINYSKFDDDCLDKICRLILNKQLDGIEYHLVGNIDSINNTLWIKNVITCGGTLNIHLGYFKTSKALSKYLNKLNLKYGSHINCVTIHMMDFMTIEYLNGLSNLYLFDVLVENTSRYHDKEYGGSRHFDKTNSMTLDTGHILYDNEDYLYDTSNAVKNIHYHVVRNGVDHQPLKLNHIDLINDNDILINIGRLVKELKFNKTIVLEVDFDEYGRDIMLYLKECFIVKKAIESYT